MIPLSKLLLNWGKKRCQHKQVVFLNSAKAEMIVEANRKLDLCNKVLNILGILTPGKVRMRGMFLSEMYGIIVFLGRYAFQNGEIGADEYLKR